MTDLIVITSWWGVLALGTLTSAGDMGLGLPLAIGATLGLAQRALTAWAMGDKQ